MASNGSIVVAHDAAFGRGDAGWTVRRATDHDATAVAGVFLASRAAYLAYAPVAHSETQVLDWVARHLIPAGGVVVAERDCAVVAFVAFSDDGVHGWIDHMYVDPRATSQGVGAALLATVLPRLRHPVRLFTFQANAGARRFYERYGFVAVDFSDGSGNEEGCPDVLYELATELRPRHR